MDLLSDVVTSLLKRSNALAFEQLRPRHTARNQGFPVCGFLGDSHCRRIDRFGLTAIAGTVEFLSSPEKGQSLQHLRAGIQELAVQLAQGIGMFECHFGCELTAALSSP